MAAVARTLDEPRNREALETFGRLVEAGYTGSITFHLQEGITQQIEEHCRKRMGQAGKTLGIHQ